MKKGKKESFDEHYSSHYGERWPHLRDRLLLEKAKRLRLNRFVFGENAEVWCRDTMEYPWAPEIIREWSELAMEEAPIPAPLEPAYSMDPASIAVARALDVHGGMNVLDLCAAPGGKALILAEALRKEGTLVANELSRSRRFKLISILKSYLPEEMLGRVQVKAWDASKVGLMQEGIFDRVLVDAPCSAEAHLLQRPVELERWSPARTRQLARRQYGILCSALLATRSGGRIVYATCSISPMENDGVIERLMKRKAEHVRLIAYDSPLGEQTSFGWQILPDYQAAGPAYYSVLEKR
jgi:16S rRNA C967 or C1407 C5-methylase (RsmB/RsmF family)